MKIQLVRHADFEALNAGYETYDANACAPLSAFGKIQARALAMQLKRLGVDKIFYSPFCRTTETAEAARDIAGITIERLDDLREHKIISAEPVRGAWKTTRDAIRANHDHAPNGSESFNQAAERFKTALDTVAASGARQPAVIAHALVLQAVLTKLFGLNTLPDLATASITTIDYTNGKYTLTQLNNRPFSLAVFIAKVRRRLKI